MGNSETSPVTTRAQGPQIGGLRWGYTLSIIPCDEGEDGGPVMRVTLSPVLCHDVITLGHSRPNKVAHWDLIAFVNSNNDDSSGVKIRVWMIQTL